jgi:hypothetical protein
MLGACQKAHVHDAAGTAAVAAAPPYCTLTLGLAQCFSDPESLPDHPPSLADGRTTLTPEQEKNQAASRWWPF